MSRPDPVTAKDTGTVKEPHPEGQFAALCVDCIDLGNRVKSYPGTPSYIAPSVTLVFQTGERNSQGHLHEVSQEFTLSMGEKANLRKFLGAWRGKTYTEEQARAGVPLHKLVGQPALVSVEHRTSGKGRTYATISSIGPLPKAMVAPTLPEYERPAFYEERRASYAAEVKAFKAAEAKSFEEMPAALQDEDDDSGLPF